MELLDSRTRKFRERLQKLPREELLELIELQDPELRSQVNRIEWVFANKLTHLTWGDGSPIMGRILTNEELSLLIDEPFEVDHELTKLGLSIMEQRQIHIAKDPVLWVKEVLGAKPRAYQILIMRHPSLKKVLRAGRRLGKTVSMAFLILHYAFTTKDGRVLVLTPMKTQGALIYEEVMKHVKNSPAVHAAITRNVTSPQYEINLTNGSTIRFFSTGMKSGGRSDVTRGQEAHMIVLDELDYMGDDDLEAVFAMLQKTSDNQPDKRLIGASTPTGRRAVFWQWCVQQKDIFQEFWFPSYCFEANTRITMADGTIRPIQDIKAGDKVLTEHGPNVVTRTFKRKHSGNIHNISWYGNAGGVRVTGEHPFSSDISRRRKKEHNWNWVDAKDLQPRQRRNPDSGSLLRFVVDNTLNTGPIDLLTLNDHLFESSPGRVKVKRQYRRGYGREFVNDFPRFIYPDDLAFATIAGWYLAEGNLDAFNDAYGCFTAVNFTLHEEELEYVDTIANVLEKLGAGSIKLINRKDSKAIKLVINNAPLAMILAEVCGVGSRQKHLSSFIMHAPLDFQETFVQSYADGDGWEKSVGNHVIRTASPILAQQIQMISARLGDNLASISVAPGKATTINPAYPEYQSGPSWAIEYNRNIRCSLGKKRVDENTFSVLVKDIKVEPYDDYVYNFEVENTNSYIANGVLVHNCNPFWDGETERFFRSQYTEMGYRHEIEADWGEDVDGVYPRKYIDMAFHGNDWSYLAERTDGETFHVMGVDWDKYGAGTNMVVLEVFPQGHPNREMAGKYRLAYREETKKEEYSLTKAVDRIINLHKIFRFKHIYVDRGFGEVQVELLHKYGIEHPASKLDEVVKGISFAESIEVRDPFRMQKVKKEIKPFMVDNLRQFLEQQKISFPEKDEELYMQLISYVVLRTTSTGRPVFEAPDKIGDHAHDALILACLAITDNYGTLLKPNYATDSYVVPNNIFLPTVELSADPGQRKIQEEYYEDKYGSLHSAPVRINRTNLGPRSRRGKGPVRRSMF